MVNCTNWLGKSAELNCKIASERLGNMTMTRLGLGKIKWDNDPWKLLTAPIGWAVISDGLVIKVRYRKIYNLESYVHYRIKNISRIRKLNYPGYYWESYCERVYRTEKAALKAAIKELENKKKELQRESNEVDSRITNLSKRIRKVKK